MYNIKIKNFLIAFFLFIFLLQPVNSYAVTKPASKTIATNKINALSPRQLIIGKWSTLYKNQPFYVEFNKSGLVSISVGGTPSNQGKIKYTLTDIPGSKTSIIIKSTLFYNPTNSNYNTNSVSSPTGNNSANGKSHNNATNNVSITVTFKNSNTMIFQGITLIRVKN
jgi:hypothetical protein